MIDPVNDELPGAVGAVDRRLDGDAVANLPAKAFGGTGTSNRALAVLEEIIPLVIRNNKLRENLALILGVDRELREKVFLILIDAAKPVVVGHGLNTRNARNLVAIRKRNRLNDGDAINGDQAAGAGKLCATGESLLHNREKGEQKQRHREGPQGEKQADLLAE